jgi:hypothetical protein
MNKYYVLKSIVENEDYFAEKVNISENGIYRESLSGVSLKSKNIKIELKKSKGKVKNNIENSLGIPIISELISNRLLELCLNEIELFEVDVNMLTNSKYYFLNILDNIDAINFQESLLVEIIPDTKVLSEVERLILDDFKIGSRQIFRLKHFNAEIIISQDLKNSLAELQLSEFKFIPIEEFKYKAGSLNKY